MVHEMSLFLRRCVMNAFFSPENQKNQNSTFCVFEHFFNFGENVSTVSGDASTQQRKRERAKELLTWLLATFIFFGAQKTKSGVRGCGCAWLKTHRRADEAGHALLLVLEPLLIVFTIHRIACFACGESCPGFRSRVGRVLSIQPCFPVDFRPFVPFSDFSQNLYGQLTWQKIFSFFCFS